MFVTTPKAEWAVPKALVPDGGKCWMEFLIPAWTPWFLVTVKVQADNSSFLQAMAVAWEQTLLGLISECPVDAIAAIQVVAPDTQRSGEWTVSRVKAVWLELFEFLRPALAEWAGEKLTEAEWREVAKLIRPVDEEFAYDFDAAVDEHFHPREFVGPPEPPTPLERCVLGASWESPSFGGGGAAWAAIASRARTRSAVRAYAARHLASTGTLPQGPHRVLLSFGPQGGADFVCPVGRSNTGTVDQVVLFPLTGQAPPDTQTLLQGEPDND